MPNITIERFKRLPQHPSDVWQGGLFAMPAWIEGPDGKLYRPHTAVWVSVEFQQVSKPRMVEPDEDHPQVALESLLSLAFEDEVRARPSVIEVNNEELAGYLDEQLKGAGVRIECVGTMDDLQQQINDMTENVTSAPQPPSALDAKGVTVDRMRSFAEAAVAFYRARPWTELADDDLIAIEHPKPPAGLGYCIVLGAGGQEFGLGFFKSPQQLEKLASAEHPVAFAARNSVWSLTYGSITELPLADADLWEKHRLPVAGDEAYPCAVHFRPRAGINRPNAGKLAYLEGLLRAIAHSTEGDFDSGRWSVTVPTFNGEKEYRLALLTMIDDDADDGTQPPRAGLNPRQRHRTMERSMANIHRLIEEKELGSVDEINAFLAAHGNNLPQPASGPQTPLEQAQELMYDAWDARGRKRRKLAKQALEMCPDCADAYVLLAEETSDVETACDLFRKGTDAGKRALGRSFFQEEVGDFWGLLETRPYMRARAGLAECLWDIGEEQAAVSHYQDLLRLNPNDNQGLRYQLAACLLQLGHNKELAKLLRAYDEDSAQWQYIKALAIFRKDGDTPFARKCLKEAVSSNARVPDYLLGRRDFPPVASALFSLGSEEEAAHCADELDEGWHTTPGAIEWLESIAGESTKN